MTDLLSMIPFVSGIPEMWNQIVLVLNVALAFLTCFLGYRLLRAWGSLYGFSIGGFIGYFLGKFMTDNSALIWLTVLICGIVTGIMAYRIFQLGVFVLGWTMVFSFLYKLMSQFELGEKYKIAYIVGSIIIAVFVGIILVKYTKTGVILFTSVHGGIGLASGLNSLLMIHPVHWVFDMAIIFIAFGIGFQYLTSSKKK